jgi:hypothetical protein
VHVGATLLRGNGRDLLMDKSVDEFAQTWLPEQRPAAAGHDSARTSSHQFTASSRQGRDPMKDTTLALQQAAVAADARPCGDRGHGSTWNASVVMAAGSLEFMTIISTKRPARHLGGQPT